MRQRQACVVCLGSVLLLCVTIGPAMAANPTSTPAPASACAGDCNGDGMVTVDEILAMVNIALGSDLVTNCTAGDVNGDGMITVDEILAAVDNALNGCIPPATPTATATAVPTLGVLGLRHFVINPAKSPFAVKLGGFTLPLGEFQGQTNGQTGPAFLDLEAGQPDATSGIATIDVTAASEFIYVDGSAGPAGIVLCIKPLVPAMKAGLITCKGGLPLGFKITQDHNIGQVGLNGFSVADCAAQQGRIEDPNEICAAGQLGVQCRANADCDSTQGAGDGVCGVGQATCTGGNTGAPCQADADCDTTAVSRDGMCGTSGLHPGVCNGPFVNNIYPGATGVGGVTLAPVPQFQLSGLPVRLTTQSSLPCVDPGPSADLTIAFTTGTSATTILDSNDSGTNNTGEMLSLTVQGQNFSCTEWQAPDAPGRFVLTAPQLDQSTVGDVITSFTLDGSP